MTDGWQLWLDWHRTICPENEAEIRAIQADRGAYMGYIRVLGFRSREARLSDPIVSLPSQYTSKPLLRGEE